MKSFGAHDVFEVVQKGYKDLGENPTDVQRSTFQDLRKEYCKMLCYIHQKVDSQHCEKISKVTKSKEAWDILERYHDCHDPIYGHDLRTD